ncbi:hypothetical protein E8D37_02150 [Nocardioides sp. GY 10127]|nr:hypothetical protein E8D37_02150 [Nocardioides sp. GY 10127]
MTRPARDLGEPGAVPGPAAVGADEPHRRVRAPPRVRRRRARRGPAPARREEEQGQAQHGGQVVGAHGGGTRRGCGGFRHTRRRLPASGQRGPGPAVPGGV